MSATGESRGWVPEPNETLSGIVEDLDKGWSDYHNAPYPIVVVRTDAGDLVNIHCFHHVLKLRMAKVSPVPGDRIEVTYYGKQATKDGKRSVAMYSVRSNRTPDFSKFWDTVTPTDAAPAPASEAPDIPIDLDDILS